MLTALVAVGLAAATPLVHEGGADWAEAEVQRVAGPEALTPRSWLALRRSPPGMASGAEIERCEGSAVGLSGLSTALDAARADFDWGDFEAAAVAAEAALALAPCLSEPATIEVLARGWRLLGVAAFHAGQLDAADSAFAEVRGVSADAEWDDSLPAQSLERFQTVAPRVEVPITAVPSEVTLLVDGQTRLAAPPGRRLLQWRTPEGLRGAWVEVGPLGAQWVVPGATTAMSLADAVADPEGSALLALLSLAWGTEAQGWLVSSEAVYRVSGDEVSRVARVSPATASALRWSTPVVAVGAVGTVVGGVASTVSLVRTRSARTAYEQAPDPGSAVEARERFEASRRWVVPAEVTLGVGAGLLAAGIGLRLGADVALIPGPRGLVVRGTIR